MTFALCLPYFTAYAYPPGNAAPHDTSSTDTATTEASSPVPGTPPPDRQLHAGILARLPLLPETRTELRLADIPIRKPPGLESYSPRASTLHELFAESAVVVRGRATNCYRDPAPRGLYICTIEALDTYRRDAHGGALLAGTTSGPDVWGTITFSDEDMQLHEGFEHVLFLGEPDAQGVRRPTNPTFGVVLRWDVPDSGGREFAFVYGARPLMVLEGGAPLGVRWDSLVGALETARSIP